MPRLQKTLTSQQYCQYLISAQHNYTLTHYAEHAQRISHDVVKLFLERERFSVRDV